MTLRERWIRFLYLLERRGWFTRWLFQCQRTFQAYRRVKPFVMKTVVEAPPAPVEEPIPTPGTPRPPRRVPQSQELVDSVSEILYGVRDPAKKLRNVKLVINYEDGSSDSWTCDRPVDVYMDHDSRSSTITLSSLEN